MPDYRLLWFDDAGGLTSAEWLEARNDSEAIAVLNLRELRQQFEIWCDQRLVAQTDRSGLTAVQQSIG